MEGGWSPGEGLRDSKWAYPATGATCGARPLEAGVAPAYHTKGLESAHPMVMMMMLLLMMKTTMKTTMMMMVVMPKTLLATSFELLNTKCEILTTSY